MVNHTNFKLNGKGSTDRNTSARIATDQNCDRGERSVW